MSWRKVFLCGALAIAVVSQGDDAFGARRMRRSSSHSSTKSAPVKYSKKGLEFYPPRVPSPTFCCPTALTQAEGYYFDHHTGTWNTETVLVALVDAQTGVLARGYHPNSKKWVWVWIYNLKKPPMHAPPSTAGNGSADEGSTPPA